ncbi:site-specific recombinase XerD [Tahibacter aquaticus]|uniref:Site-specific recombinase XerD n=1 Tax=Tahibacter aquaticus TaxID=520092 RepID=A0A4V3DL96_9GAMM|nr:tyrosine-type recombinase/integrase [Tahibacter aquaticus]TDR38426.1 site-specific recombinase XerD [Tahibacter aquaticus]
MTLALPTEVTAALATREQPLVIIRPAATPQDLAAALVKLARLRLPLAYEAMDAWWAMNSGAARHALVFRLASALDRVDSKTAEDVLDPRWRAGVGIPLALATFAATWRGRRRSRAGNSIKALSADWRVWRTWCKSHHMPSFNPSARQLRAFLAWYAPTHKLASIQRWGSSLSTLHEAAGFSNPLKSPLNRDVWLAALNPPDPTKAGVRTDRRNVPVRQAEGLTREHLERVLAAIDTKTLIGARDAALLATTYDLLGRRSEVVALDGDDIRVDDETSQGIAQIRRSKTDQRGQGKALFLRRDTCVRILLWIDRAKLDLDEPALFRSLRGFAGHGSARPRARLPASELAKIIRKRVASAGLFDGLGLTEKQIKARIARFSGHSLRVGAAQDMVAAGISDVDLMNSGRWKSLKTVARYTDALRAKHGGMAKLAELQDAAGARAPMRG